MKTCYCGCGEVIPETATWVSGHDSIALGKLIQEHGGIAGLIDHIRSLADEPDSVGQCCLACGRDPQVPMDRHLQTCREVRAEVDALEVDDEMRKDGLSWGEYRRGIRWVNGKKTQLIPLGGGVPLDQDPVYGPPTGEY